jgi:Coenzyme PQQ synthesis protein D (PqqD)
MAPNENISLDTTVVASKEQASADLGDEAAILNLKDGVYYGLDPVGARIWKLVQSPRTVREIRDTLLAEYDVESDRCEKDLIALLEELAGHELIDVVDNV